MNKQINILVLGISGNVSFGILRVLMKNFPNYNIIGACVKETINRAFCNEFIVSPYANTDQFLDWIYLVCERYEIDIIYSGVEEIISKLSTHEEQIYQSCGTYMTFPTLKAIQIGSSKLKTVEWLKDNNLNHPKYTLIKSSTDIAKFAHDINKECILKPILGKGSSGLFTINPNTDMDKIRINYADYIIQECIGSSLAEYTVGCYQNQKGDIMNPLVMRRRLNNGHTVEAEIVQNDKITDYCKEIMNCLKPMGPINIQLRLDEFNDPVCFEINPRFSGTTLIRDQFGFKDVVSILHEKLHKKFNDSFFNFQSSGFCIRLLDEFFTDKNLIINNTPKFYHYD